MLAGDGGKIDRGAADGREGLAPQDADQHRPHQRKGVDARIAGPYLAALLRLGDEAAEEADGAQHDIVIAGGLGLRLADHLARSGFRDRFMAKGRFERRMDEMPVHLITHQQPGLFGAAAAFAEEFGQ